MKRIQKTNESQPQVKKRKKRVPRFRKGPLIFLAFFAALFITSGWQLYQLQVQVSQKIEQLNTEKQKLLEEKASLEKEIVQLNTPSYIEQLAREQLGLVKKGEIMISPKKQ